MKKLLQKIRILIGNFLIDKNNRFDSSRYALNKILFLRQDGRIGDYVVSSFVFRELKKWNPNLKIGLVCTLENQYLFSQNEYIDQLYLVKKRSIKDYIRCGLMLRKENYDLIIDPTIFLRNRDLLLLRLINAKVNIGYQKEGYKLFNQNIPYSGQHFSQVYASALDKIGLKNIELQYDVPFNQQAATAISKFLKENHLQNYIAINFFGNSTVRKMHDKNIIAHLHRLTDNFPDKKFVLLSYPDINEKLINLVKTFDNVFVYPTTEIFHTIELIKYCQQLISVDTSTIHIASGFNKSIIGFYPNDEENFAHWRPMTHSPTHILFFDKTVNEIMPDKINLEWIIS
ncbi:glycosyltransferase family 9 protein [Rodentibacter sp. Ppn85]|uniref:glycosyltransferase family 9 protein n=1 Tax=Rodentibacter sp. Ppn85 TaxID=1908525 RepID=UPI0009857E9C|nr:glycosyltransferase family 9 protein [Rodentibacter sp. Ppn85]OOF63273.1 heptosyltransferase [Rodentibacter sp. Ppn85]